MLSKIYYLCDGDEDDTCILPSDGADSMGSLHLVGELTDTIKDLLDSYSCRILDGKEEDKIKEVKLIRIDNYLVCENPKAPFDLYYLPEFFEIPRPYVGKNPELQGKHALAYLGYNIDNINKFCFHTWYTFIGFAD